MAINIMEGQGEVAFLATSAGIAEVDETKANIMPAIMRGHFSPDI